MSRRAPIRSRLARRKRRFSIVASRFNERYVRGLVEHATKELNLLSPNADISLHHVPGAFEIPIVVREIALQKKADAILALGVILEGKTSHAEHLARSVTDALQQISIIHGTPVINAVLSVKNDKQAHERCLGSKINRGTEAAQAAVEIADRLKELRTKSR